MGSEENPHKTVGIDMAQNHRLTSGGYPVFSGHARNDLTAIACRRDEKSLRRENAKTRKNAVIGWGRSILKPEKGVGFGIKKDDWDDWS